MTWSVPELRSATFLMKHLCLRDIWKFASRSDGHYNTWTSSVPKCILHYGLRLDNFIFFRKNYHRFAPMTSYQRMIVHKVADYFGMEHNTDASGITVVVSKSRNTRVPESNFNEFIRWGVTANIYYMYRLSIWSGESLITIKYPEKNTPICAHFFWWQ